MSRELSDSELLQWSYTHFFFCKQCHEIASGDRQHMKPEFRMFNCQCLLCGATGSLVPVSNQLSLKWE